MSDTFQPTTSAAYDPGLMFAELQRDEGVRQSMYRDSRGYETVGIGHNMAIPQSMFTVTALYQNDINGCEASLDSVAPWWRSLDPVRQRAMVNLMFNMGGATLRTFTTFLSLMEQGDYDGAALDLSRTTWAGQVGARSTRIEGLIRSVA